MKLAPPEFDGPFSEFFSTYVLPNLPTVERLKEFDLRLRRYLEGPVPVHPVRKVAGQKRGEICETECGGKMLPTDNAPVWWIHAFISTNDAFSIENDQFFENLPSHMFQLSKRRANLNSAGFHAAHIVAAKNRDTAWRAWDQAELRRRTLVNIHPCNMFLISKTDWRVWGGDADVLKWIQFDYIERYGGLMTSFLSDIGVKVAVEGKPTDFRYCYPKSRPEELTIKAVPTARKHGQGNTVILKRPMIKRNLLGSGAMLEISVNGCRYLVAHDRLFEWVGSNTKALKSRSWLEGGLYSWPRPSRQMTGFLEQFEI